MRARRHRDRVRDDDRDRGASLIVVVGSMFVLTLFLMVQMATVLRSAEAGRRDQDAKTAVAAAQAGIEDYVSRLNQDSDYWRTGNQDGANPALGTGDGQVVPGLGDASATYRYRLLGDATDTSRTGAVRLRVTGSSSPGQGRAAIARTLTATLIPKSFLDFVYLSDIEVVDPTLVGADPRCAAYAYGPESRLALRCPQIVWKTGDRVDGPLHSNDALTINGAADFRHPQVGSSWPDIRLAAPGTRTWQGSAHTLPGNRPAYAAPLPLPSSNTEMLRHVAPDADGDGAVGPGCYYRGATRITFAGALMRVLSPGTSDPATPSRCLDVSRRHLEQTLPVPPVVYVDASPDACDQGAVGYPVPGESVAAGGPDDPAWGTSTNYDCRRGTAYVSGVLDGQVTVTTRHDVVVTGDLVSADGGTGDDVLGLVASGYTWIHHPVDATGAELDGSPRVSTLHAGILCLHHSFVVQNWAKGGPLGPLTVLGSIAQRLRGPVGTQSTSAGNDSGYLKDYRYDVRFQTLQPPFFLKPGADRWRVREVTDG